MPTSDEDLYPDKELAKRVRGVIQGSLDRPEMQGVHRSIWTAAVALELLPIVKAYGDQRAREALEDAAGFTTAPGVRFRDLAQVSHWLRERARSIGGQTQ